MTRERHQKMAQARARHNGSVGYCTYAGEYGELPYFDMLDMQAASSNMSYLQFDDFVPIKDPPPVQYRLNLLLEDSISRTLGFSPVLLLSVRAVVLSRKAPLPCASLLLLKCS